MVSYKALNTVRQGCINYLFYVSNEIQIYSFFVAQLHLLVSLSQILVQINVSLHQILVQINVISINSSTKKHNSKASLATDLQQN